MIKEISMYTVICDNCGKDLHENDEYSGFNDIAFVEDSASDAGWHKEDEKHYCPGCFSFDDEDQLVIDKSKKVEVRKTKTSREVLENVLKQHIVLAELRDFYRNQVG